MEGLNDFLQALKRIPNDEKRAYLLALARAPHLLHRESCIERFLRCDHKQADKVARKFVDYWEKRKQVFDDAAFQPLTLSARWTLSESCKSLLQSGWISPLPKDSAGRRVCLLNLSVERGQHHILPEDKARCIFFILQCLSEDKLAQSDGISLLVVYDDVPHTSHTASIKALDEILQVIPIRVGSLHVVYSGDRDGRASFFENVVPMTLKALLNSPVDGDQDAILERRSHIHMSKSVKITLEELERDGFRRDSLPNVLGGNWTSVHHDAWLKVREQDELGKVSEAQPLGIFSFPGKDATTGGAVAVDVREKLRDAWHSKLKRTRKRCRTKALQIHVAHLREQQRKAKETTTQLEQALKEAKHIVSTIQASHVGSPFAGMTTKPHATAPMALHSMRSMILEPPHAHEEARRLLGFTTGVPSDSLNLALRVERAAALRAERDRLFIAAMTPSRAMPVLTLPIGSPEIYSGIARQPVLYEAPLSSLAPLSDLAVARGFPLRTAIAQPGTVPRQHERNHARYF